MKRKPDGYIAWHPKEGFCIPTFVSPIAKKITSWKLLTDTDCGGYDFCDLSFPEYDEKEMIKRAKREGWKVRPVKLVFLDEEEK